MRRLATPADCDAVYAIYMHPDVVPFLGFDPMPRSDFESVFASLLASEHFYVVEVAGCVQGFYKVSRNEGRAAHGAYLSTLAVAPSSHGRGLARAMVIDAIHHLQAEGVRRVDLLVEADNPRAIAFYRKLGFEVEGRLRGAYRRRDEPQDVDEILMGLLLSAAPFNP